ncbi:DUF2955 domain-containing protein [Shewanella olleyana]|uniref:DUF2955 domain-containing protein n=1 Tax=Shewanella olleyana TaxID=135626 RepID=UPI002010A63B|nr:DUF2955 domain-containing protein [Shewanella olleyana]MCL1065816.1 DUF2955 domain-containing protein [Shewanella olleyana]
MFRSVMNPIIRLALAPTLLLFYMQYSGAALPFLAPIFVVIFLTMMPSKPPLSLMLKLLIALFFISFVIVFFASVLADTPTGFGLFCWSLLFWGYFRSHIDSKDILSTLILMVVIIITVMTEQFHTSIDGFPWLMCESLFIAIVVTSVFFIIFPGDEKDILPDDTVHQTGEVALAIVIFKATAMWLILQALIGFNSSQTILIAITISNLIKIPTSPAHKVFIRNKLVTTVTGILFTLPVLFLYTVGTTTWVLIGVSIFCAMQLACYAIRRHCRFSIYQLLFTNFIVLIYQVLKHQGADSVSAELLRLLSIIIAILIGGIILNLVMTTIESKDTKLNEQ